MGKGLQVTNNIRRLRFEQGVMTQQALADKTGVTRQTILAIEAGKYSPSLALAFRIARAFGVGLDEVFEFDDTAGEATGAQSQAQD